MLFGMILEGDFLLLLSKVLWDNFGRGFLFLLSKVLGVILKEDFYCYKTEKKICGVVLKESFCCYGAEKRLVE